MEIEYLFGLGIVATGGIFGLLFKINRCLGRQEGEIRGLRDLLMQHLKISKD